MGVENIERISSQLIANGRSADCPAAVIRWGTRPEQRTLVTTLGQAAADVKKHNLKPPAIFLVGEVVKLRSQLQWFDNKPLFGKTVIVTRARAQASQLTKQLEEQGARVLEAPSIKIVPAADYAPLQQAISNIDSYKWLVLTSSNGVEYFFEQLTKTGKDSRSLYGVKIAAIGSATAKALAAHGITADLVPSAYKAEELADALQQNITSGDKVLIARAKVAREVLPERLRELGAQVDVVTAYETVTDCENKDELLALLENGEADMITFTSSSTVTNMLDILGNKKDLLQKTVIAAIGPVTAATCIKNGLTPAVTAAEYTIDGLMSAIQSYYKE